VVFILNPGAAGADSGGRFREEDQEQKQKGEDDEGNCPSHDEDNRTALQILASSTCTDMVSCLRANFCALHHSSVDVTVENDKAHLHSYGA
jgi:hypothetical protein